MRSNCRRSSWGMGEVPDPKLNDIFVVIWTSSLCLSRSVENACTIQSVVVAFMDRDTTLNGIFSIFSGTTYWPYGMFKELSMDIKKIVLYVGNLFFVLIPGYCVFGVMYILRSVKLQVCSWQITMLYWSLGYFKTILKLCTIVPKRHF